MYKRQHIDLCAYIYSEIMAGRQEMLDQYLANRAKEGETLEHAADSKSDAEAAGHDSQSESPDGLAVVAEKRGLRAWLATCLLYTSMYSRIWTYIRSLQNGLIQMRFRIYWTL